MRQRAPLGIETTFSMAEIGRRWLTPTACRLLVIARRERDSLESLPHVLRDMQSRAIALNPGFLRGDRDAFFHRRRIVGADLRPDAILQRRNDLPRAV